MNIKMSKIELQPDHVLIHLEVFVSSGTEKACHDEKSKRDDGETGSLMGQNDSLGIFGLFTILPALSFNQDAERRSLVYTLRLSKPPS